jgi:4-amino-4-deoxy-L-arabinose transferase-like glycosyltransferase
VKYGFSEVKNYVSSNRRILALSGGFFLFTFLLSLFYPRFSDSVIHMVRSDYIFSNLSFPFAEFGFNSPKAYVYPPIFHILIGVSRTLTGFYGLIPSFMGGLSIFLTYKLVNLWYDERTALQTALALALFPFFIIWSAKIYIGTTITAGFLLTFYLYFRYREKGERRFLYYSFIVGGLLTALKTYGPLAPALVGIHLLWMERGSLDDILTAFKNAFLPGLAGVIASLPWPIRNMIKTGSPFPKVTGVPFSCLSEGTMSGVWVWVPRVSELVMMSTRITGVMFPSVLSGLNQVHPVVYYSWFALPLLMLGLTVYGAIEEKDNEFIWMWMVSLILLYEVQRVLSQGVVSFKFRHFITLSPVFALFFVRSYQKIPVRKNFKRIFFGLLAAGLILQTAVTAAVFIDSMSTSYGPMGDWVDENVPEKDVIYSPHARQVIAYTQNDYKVISRSCKPGYIDPDENFGRELYKKADWVVVADHPSSRKDLKRVQEAEQEGFVELVKELDTTENRIYGELGRKWMIYRVERTED